MMTLLAYIPFVHPMNVFHEWWLFLLLPLSFGIATIYKAVRLHTLENFWRQVTVMSVQIVLAMIGLALAVTVIVWIIPYLAIRPQ